MLVHIFAVCSASLKNTYSVAEVEKNRVRIALLSVGFGCCGDKYAFGLMSWVGLEYSKRTHVQF
jgi:hypothetical protein